MSPLYAVVTGCSRSSIGFKAAQILAASPHNFRVVLGCRNPVEGKAAEEAIRAMKPQFDPVYVHLDLASFSKIKLFVQELHELDDGAIVKDGLPLLINNAGVGFGGKDTPFEKTQDGLEEIVGVNHFGHFLMTTLLLDDLKRFGQSRQRRGARIVVVSSSLHDAKVQMGGDSKSSMILPEFPDGVLKQPSEDYNAAHAYRVSKLCNIWFTKELQRRLDLDAANKDDSGNSLVTVNALCPGFIPTTGLTRKAGTFGQFFLKYVLDSFRYLGMGPTRSPEDGANAIVGVATDKRLVGAGGRYFLLPRGMDQVEEVSSSEESMDELKAQQLWAVSGGIVGGAGRELPANL